MATDKTLTAHLRVTGENASKAAVKGLGEEVGKTGDKVTELARDTDHLTESLADAEKQYKGLIATFKETGEIDKKLFGKAKRELKFFENLKKEIEAELQQVAVDVASPNGGGAAGLIGEGLAKGIGAAVARAGPGIWAALGASAIAAMPFLGGVIASAVAGGTGLGGIAGGIALAAQDSRVKDAARQLGDTASTAFKLAGQEFVLPTIDSLQMLERASQDVATRLGAGFRAIAPTLKPLTEGAIGFADELVDSLAKSMEAAKPVIRAIANELPEIGAALGDFFEIITEDPDGAILAFQQLSEIIQGTLRFSGHLIATLSDIFAWTVRTGEAMSGFAADMFGWIPVVGGIWEDTEARFEGMLAGLEKSGDASRDFAGGLHRVATEADRAAEELDAMRQASDRLFDRTMGLDEATLALKKTISETREVLLDGKRTLDDNTDAGQENLTAIYDRIRAIETMRDKEAESTLGLEEANKRYAERLRVLKDELLQMGFNKKAVEDLIAKYMAVPNAIQVEFRLKAGGDAQAWSAFRAMERQQFEKNKTIGNQFFTEFIDQRASGGPTRAGRTYLVGENGPELWSENANGYITNAAQTQALMSGASGGMARTPTLTRVPGGGDPGLESLIDFLWPAFLKRVRVDGGDLAAFGAA